MKIGIYDLNECSSLNYERRLQIYKQYGFTSVGLYLDDNYMSNNESYVDIIKCARENGLEVNQVHVDYKISNFICDDSEVYFEYVEGKLNECINLCIPYMVLHASKGDNAPVLGDEELKKLKDLMCKYKDTKVYLCFENVRDNRNLEIILSSNINNVAMCYDLGHAYCYDNEFELLNRYKDVMLCTHLHNNNGKDTHNRLLGGQIDCKKIIPLINETKNIDNCLEVFPSRDVKLSEDEFKEFVKSCYSDYILCAK